MKNFLVILVLLGFNVSLFAQEEATPAKPAAKQAAKLTATWSSGDTQVTAAGPRGLSLREARKMGLTVNGIGKAVKELKEAGAITEETSDAEVSAMVANHIFAKNSSAWGDPSALNWDSILAFIEKMLPIILKLIDLFSYAPPAYQLPLPVEALHLFPTTYSLSA